MADKETIERRKKLLDRLVKEREELENSDEPYKATKARHSELSDAIETLQDWFKLATGAGEGDAAPRTVKTKRFL